MAGMVAHPEAIGAAVDRFGAAQGDLAAVSFAALTGPEALAVKGRLETVARRRGALDHRLTSQLDAQSSPVGLGGRSWTDVLANRLRLGDRGQLDRLDRLGVAVHIRTPVERIVRGGSVFDAGGQRREQAADTVLLAGSLEPDTAMYDALT